jgi:cysteine desulfurase/selenocysteine lyase
MNVEAVRKDFPILGRMVHGHPLVYLDSTATSQKPKQVLETVDDFYRNHHANVHRGLYVLSEEATAAYEDSRETVRAFINAPSVQEIIFTRNATESLNLVAMTWGRENIGAGDVILLSEFEHHSNIVPWQRLAKEKGATIEWVAVTDEGILDQASFDAGLAKKPKLVSFTHMSNVLGTVNPVAEVTTKAHAAGAVVVVDGAQSAPHFPVDVQAIGCDFFVFSGHKMLAPTGTGVLYGKKALLEAMPPFMGGGDMILEVTKDGATWNDLPYKFEAGTPNFAGFVGLAAAIDYLSALGMENIWAHEQELTAYGVAQLSAVAGLTLYGPRDTNIRGAVFPFSMSKVHPHDIAAILDEQGIAVRAGHHCAQVLHTKLGVPATSRASAYVYTTKEDIDALINGLREVRKIFPA